MQMHRSPGDTGTFSRDITGLPMAGETQDLHLADGDELDLRIAPVAMRILDEPVRMLAYNGSIPGPALRVRHIRRSCAGPRTRAPPRTCPSR